MSEPSATPEPPADGLPHAVERERRPRSLQIVWIIPVVAILAGAWLGISALMEQGPTITIRFNSAEGIEAGKTKIRYKSVDVGTVRSLGLTEDRQAAIVTAEMDREISKGFLVEDTKFWVVRPRIAGGQVSGLGTLLAGSYIGVDPGQSKSERRSFTGLETPPPITSDVPGKQFTLAAEQLGSLDINSPLYYRGVLAGRVVSTEIAPDGKRVIVGVFIPSPYDRFVNAGTRFWNASGVDLALDASGVRLQTQSLVTLLLGGIYFETPPEDDAGAQPAAEKTRFTLWENRAEAFRARETVVEPYVLKFAQSVRGLAIGAPVDFRGIVAGEVRKIYLEFDPARVHFLTVVEVNVWPERLRSRLRSRNDRPYPELTSKQRMQRFVERGLRAQLRNANLITGQLYVALDFFPKAQKASMDLAGSPPEIPTIPGGLAELQESVVNIIATLEKVPFDKLAEDLRGALRNLEATLKKADTLLGQLSAEIAPELRSTLEQARKTLGAAQQTLSSDSPVQGDLRETLNEVTKAAEGVRELVDYLERHPESLLRGKRGGERK